MEQTLPEGPIKLGANGMRRLVLGIVFAALPALGSLIYLDFQTSEHTRDAQSQRLIESALIQRAALIKHDHDVLISQVEEVLRTTADGAIETALEKALPNANNWQVIPLDDMGVASLMPADYGLGSLVLLDRVRQVFNTGNSQFEVVRQNNTVTLALVSRFSSKSAEGVAIVTFPSDLARRWINASPVGTFSIWQRMGTTQTGLIAGPDNLTEPENNRVIAGTDWALALKPNNGLVPPQASVSPLVWLLILGGLFVAFWLCVAESKRLLAANVRRISEAADSRSPLTLDFPELAPLALTLRQLSSNKKLRDKRAPAEYEQEQVTVESQPAEQPTENLIKTPWTISNGSWVVLPPISVADEAKAITELARSIASTTLRGPNRSFALSSLGDELARDAKTKLTKALLSCGIDVVNLNDAPLPVVHMATHNATASGSALVIKRDQNGTLHVGAIVNRSWVASNFWQQILSAPHTAENISGNGRSVKFSLESEYCERIAGDIALADSLKIVLTSDNQAMLEIAERSLKSMLCDVVTHRADFHDAAARMGTWLTSESADVGVFIDADKSRLVLFDEMGQRISDDHALMLIIQDTLARHPGCDVLLGPRASRSLPAFIGSFGGASTVVTCRPQVIQQEMQAKGALVAGDSAGAIFIKDRWFGSNDPLYSAARIAEIVSNSGNELSALIATLPITTTRAIRLSDSPELHAALLDVLSDEGNFAGAHISRIDGVRVDFADSWAHIEPAEDSEDLHLRLEGDDVECCNRLSTLLVNILERNHPDLALLLRDALATNN